MTPQVSKKSCKFSPLYKPNFEKKMRKEIFNDSKVYMGFSSFKKGELADGELQPAMYRSQLYKEEEPVKPYSLKPTMSRRVSNPQFKNIREYSESRTEFLDTLNKDAHTRSSS